KKAPRAGREKAARRRRDVKVWLGSTTNRIRCRTPSGIPSLVRESHEWVQDMSDERHPWSASLRQCKKALPPGRRDILAHLGSQCHPNASAVPRETRSHIRQPHLLDAQ